MGINENILDGMIFIIYYAIGANNSEKTNFNPVSFKI